MGYRNGLYRINPSALSILVIPLSFWLISKAKSKREKLTYVITILIDIFYAYIIWQARSALLYKTIIIIMLIFLHQTNDKKKVVIAFIMMIGAVVLINTPVFNTFVDSFSKSNETYGSSTIARVNAYAYYGTMYLKSPFWGVGCLATSERYAPGVAGGMLEDTGFFYGVVQLGVPIILFYIVVFFRGIYISIKLRKKNIADSLLCLSMTLLFVMFGINMDPFYAFALALPFYVSFVEYVRWNNVKENGYEGTYRYYVYAIWRFVLSILPSRFSIFWVYRRYRRTFFFAARQAEKRRIWKRKNQTKSCRRNDCTRNSIFA